MGFTEAEYSRQQRANAQLTYIDQTNPDRGVSLSYGSTTVKGLKIMVDTGSNIMVIGEKSCIALGIPIRPTNATVKAAPARAQARDNVSMLS